MPYLNVFDHAQPIEREGTENAFNAAPFETYSAALADMLASKDRLAQLSPALQQILAPVAGVLSAESIAAALAGKPGDAQRAALLEAARLWFTEKLHAAISHAPLFISWTRDERVKL